MWLLALCLACSIAVRHGPARVVGDPDGPAVVGTPVAAPTGAMGPILQEERSPVVVHATAHSQGGERFGPAPRAPVTLSAEQDRLAAFIAQRYQVAIDMVSEVVSASYAIAREHRLDPLLILAVVAVESRFDPLAQSPKGAQGLMQILTRVHAGRFEAFGGVAAVFDPITNLRVGVAILHEYLRRDDSLSEALKAYVGAAHLPHDRGFGARVLQARSDLEQAVGVGEGAGGGAGAVADGTTRSTGSGKLEVARAPTANPPSAPAQSLRPPVQARPGMEPSHRPVDTPDTGAFAPH